jgi:hypothetical protein
MPKIITNITNKELTTKLTLIVIGLAAACSGYILFLAIAAPQQLAEATTAATNVVCNGCVGTSDIADNSIYSVDIRNGQVATADIQDRTIRRGDVAVGSLSPSIIFVVSDGEVIPAGETGQEYTLSKWI